MGLKQWMRLVLTAPLLLAGCKGFWDATGSDFTISSSGSITVSPGATSGNTSTITVTPSGSFTGTVDLTCAVTASPSNASSPVTCDFSPTSVTLSSSAQTATLTATTTSTTTTGSYTITVTGTSGSATTTATECVTVGSSSGSCSSSGSGSSGNFYVLNVATKQIAGFSVSSGKLKGLTGSPYTAPATPLSIAIAPSGAFLYLGTSSGIYEYTISSSGQLALGNSSAPVSSDQAISMQVSPDGKWLVEVASGAPYVYAIAINSSTGALASANEQEQFAVLPVSSVQQVVISPDQSYVFVAMGAGGTATIPFNGNNGNPLGAVGRIGLENAAGSALSVAVDPLQSGQTTPRLFYVGETAATSGSNTGGLRVFNFSTLTELSGSPLTTNGLAPYAILPISTGNYVYVVNRQVSGSNTGVIAGYAVAGSSNTYSVTALGKTFTVGTNPVGLAEDSTGTYVLAVDYGGSPDLQAFTFDSTNGGYLDAGASGATGTDPVQASAIAAMP